MKENIRMLLRENMQRPDGGLLGSEIVPRYRSIGVASLFSFNRKIV
jgi:hypothetical protein